MFRRLLCRILGHKERVDLWLDPGTHYCLRCHKDLYHLDPDTDFEGLDY